MQVKQETSWLGNMKFDAIVSGHHVIMDASEAVGGEDSGPRPKELMLTALAGCTGMDVVAILKKMRSEPEKFSIEVVACLQKSHGTYL